MIRGSGLSGCPTTLRACVIVGAWLLQFQSAKGQEYVGSKACARCHADVAARYAPTAMAKASGLASDLKLPAGMVTATKARVTYALSQTAEGVRLEYRKSVHGQGAISGSKLLEYFIGSGDHGRGLIFEEQGQPFQAPIAYYSKRPGGWDLAPGYEDESAIFLSRKTDSNCLGCHASGISDSKTQPLFAEGAVSCERCHGPGSTHVDAMSKGDLSHSVAIVNPAKLEGEARDSVCAQCHLFGQTRINKPGHSAVTFRPGDRLTDHVISFEDRSAGSQQFKVIGHFEGLWASKCKRVSGDKLWCGTCHGPHHSPAVTQRITYFRDKCNVCHDKRPCALPLTSRAAADNSCIACHMPQRETTDGQHTSFTDHSIRRKAGSPNSANPFEDVTKPVNTLTPFWSSSVTARETALAEADVAFQDRDRARLQEAFKKLKAVSSGLPNDPEVNAQLGYLYQLNGDASTALTLYQQCLSVDPFNLISLTNLGGHLAGIGHTEAAIQLWRRSLAVDPGVLASGLNLARTEAALGNTRAAIIAAHQVLSLHPDSEDALKLAARLEKSGK